MAASTVEGNSLLTLDVGAVTTRAALFDVVEGRYRFVGMGKAPTTSATNPPNIVLGAQLAIENLQSMISKPLMDEEGRLLVPSQPDGSGVDGVVTILSAGAALKTVVVGLLADVSLKSVETLAQTTYARIVERIGLNDSRRLDEQVNAIVRQSPDLILVAGGVDGGAQQSLRNLIETVGLASYLLPESRRPAVLYAGNAALREEVKASLAGTAFKVQTVANIRPALEVEDLVPAQRELSRLVIDIRQREMPELEELRTLSGGVILPSAFAQGRMARFLASYYGEGKNVLSVDIGASAVSMAASMEAVVHLNVFPHLGLGEGLSGLLQHFPVEDILRWVSVEAPEETVRSYLYQKVLYPSFVPATVEELALEHALIKQNLFTATQLMLQRLPRRFRSRGGMLPSFEPILVSGTPISAAPTQGQKLLLVLDGLQPVGITTLALDTHNLLAMLGAAAEVNPLLPVQALDSGALSNLATVIVPTGSLKLGTPMLRAKLIQEDGTETTTEVNMGNLQVMPLANGKIARLQLRPLNRADVGLGVGRALEVDVTGSEMGIVIDARGRPLQLPADAPARIALHKKWLKTVEG